MALFRYEAADINGKILRGAMDARSASDVQQTLLQRGYKPVQIAADLQTQAAQRVPVPANGLVFGGAKPEEIGMLFRQLTSLIHAGFSVGAALSDLALRTARSLHGAVGQMANRVQNGASIANEMAQHPNVFAPHIVALTYAGETGGFLEFAFEEIALNAEQDTALRQGLWLAKFLIWQSVWSIILLQPMVTFLGELVKGDFKLYAQHLIVSWIVLGLIAHIGAILIRFVWRQPTFTEARDRIALRIPVMAWLARVRAMAVFTRVLRRLLMSGISAEPAFTAAARAIPNTVLAARMLTGAAIVRAGNGMDEAVKAAGLMDDDPIQLLVTGQKTGQWIEMLDRVTAFYQDEAARAMEAAKSAQRRMGVLLTIISTGYVTIVLTWGMMQGQFMLVNRLFNE